MRVTCALLLTFLGLRTGVAHNGPLESSAISKLTAHLLKSHEKASPPDGFLIVHYQVELVQIIKLDEVAQTITVLVYIFQEWLDKTLSWNPADFGNLTHTWLPETDVWLPDILIFNMVRHDNLLHSVRAPVTINHRGLVGYTYPGVYTVTCNIDISNFPFDKQHCPLEIASWEYSQSKMVLNVSTKHIQDHYSENEEWHLVKIDVREVMYQHEDNTVSAVFFDIFIKRKPLFYMFSLVLPSFIICTISIFGLFAPFSSTGERQEKFTLGVTSILTMAVLSLMVSEKVPHSSTNVPLLVSYFMLEMILITIATGMTGVIMSIHQRYHNSTEPPYWLMKVLWMLEDEDTWKTSQMSQSLVKESQVTETEALVQVAQAVNKLSQQLLRPLSPNEEALTHSKWVQIANRLDTISMLIFQIVLVCFTAYMAFNSHMA